MDGKKNKKKVGKKRGRKKIMKYQKKKKDPYFWGFV